MNSLHDDKTTNIVWRITIWKQHSLATAITAVKLFCSSWHIYRIKIYVHDTLSIQNLGSASSVFLRESIEPARSGFGRSGNGAGIKALVPEVSSMDAQTPKLVGNPAT